MGLTWLKNAKDTINHSALGQSLEPQRAAQKKGGNAPDSSRMRRRSRTSPRYSALWKRPITSLRISAIFSILASFSRLPVMRYRKESRSKFFVFCARCGARSLGFRVLGR